MKESNFPEGWDECSVEMLAKFIDYRGRTPKKTPNGIPLITAKNIRDGYINREPREYIAESDYEGWMTRGIPNVGDVVITTEAPMGNVAVIDIDEKFALAQRAICLQCYEPETSIFLHYALRNPVFQKLLTLNATGTTVSGIKAATLKKLNIPIPPLAEQKVIADKLDTLLAQVETTKVRLERIPKILKTFRQSVLAAAVSGKLTEQWREENEVSIESWVSTNIGSLAQVATGKTPKRTNAEYWGGGDVPWLTSAATGAALTFEAEQFVTKLAVKECTLKLFPIGTLLLAMYGEGKTRGQVTELQLEATCNQACAAILVDETKVSKEFLKLRLQENYVETRKAAAGGAQPNLNLNKVREITVDLPSELEQAQIVRRVEELFAFADRIEQKANAALERVNNLTQSILAKAFRGELTVDWRAQNPYLISGDNRAEALLEKIKAEREANKSANKGKKKLTRKTKKEIQPKILLENPVVGVLNKIGIAKPQAIFDELKELMDLREVLKEISQLLEQQVIKEIDKDGQQYLEINR